MRQVSFASAEYAGKKRVTRREKFLGEMAQVVPWDRLQAVIEPHYPGASQKTENKALQEGRQGFM